MVKLTKEQRKALFKIFQRDFPGWVTPRRRHERPCCPQCGYGGATVQVSSIAYRNFRKKVTPYLSDNSCVMVPWHGMWLGIERDGHTHS